MFDNVIDEQRLVEQFIELTKIDAVSLNERKIADRVKEKIIELGEKPYEDNCYEVIGGNAGNVYFAVDGSKDKAPVLFVAHLDTVAPGINKKPKVVDGRIVSDGTTVLGADDIGGVSAILEAVRILKENNIPHRPIEVLFPVAEEIYVKGSKNFDYSKIKAKKAYVLDLSGEIGKASLREPTLISFKIVIKGKAAHAGFEPEKGVNAISIFAEAVSQIKQGRIDEATTVNIGVVNGGTVTNAVPASVSLEGEIRSFVHEKALEQIESIKNIFKEAAKKYGGAITIEKEEVNLAAYNVEKDEQVVKDYVEALNKLNIEPQFTQTFGGSDNNSLRQNGINGIVLACAMEKVHTVDEYCEISSLVKLLKIVLALAV